MKDVTGLRSDLSKKIAETLKLHARIAELEAQLEAIGAGGVEPLRRRECLHQICEPTPAPASGMGAADTRKALGV